MKSLSKSVVRKINPHAANLILPDESSWISLNNNICYTVILLRNQLFEEIYIQLNHAIHREIKNEIK
jgi:hypothetical protein